MEVSDQELRGLVRDAIARHAGAGGDRPVAPPVPFGQVHTSHGVFLLHVSLSELAARLDEESFLQVHLSLIHISEPTRPY